MTQTDSRMKPESTDSTGNLVSSHRTRNQEWSLVQFTASSFLRRLFFSFGRVFGGICLLQELSFPFKLKAMAGEYFWRPLLPPGLLTEEDSMCHSLPPSTHVLCSYCLMWLTLVECRVWASDQRWHCDLCCLITSTRSAAPVFLINCSDPLSFDVLIDLRLVQRFERPEVGYMPAPLPSTGSGDF